MNEFTAIDPYVREKLRAACAQIAHLMKADDDERGAISIEKCKATKTKNAAKKKRSRKS